jgi:hypothetical protein
MKTRYTLLFILLFSFSLSAQRPVTTGTIYLNLNSINTNGQFMDIPVSFTSPDTVTALDLALKYNESMLKYDSIVNKATYLTDILGFYSPDTKTLKVTSNSRQKYSINQPIFSIRFNMLSTHLTKNDLSELVGYLNGDRVQIELKGNFPFRQCSLKFWLDNSPIRYDANNPDSYLITTIKQVDTNCIVALTTPALPDLNGNFTIQSKKLKVERDILSSTPVQAVINVSDIELTQKIIINDLSLTPTIYQLIAADVNTDGTISAGDLSQINMRTAGTIMEFKQKWNYNSIGNSNGIASKDWLFADSTLLAGPAYVISTTYPFSDGIGFSKTKVPVIPFCLAAPAVTASTAGSTYTGIMLGDVNGNYAGIVNDGRVKRFALANTQKKRSLQNRFLQNR